MDDSPVRRLVNQCRSNDVDAKVDAITKLQAELEAGCEIPDPDALIQALKTCLRTPNQHLTTATLAALPSAIPLLVTRPPAQIPLPSSSTSPAASTSSVTASPVDAHALRQVLTQLMPAGGGVLDRLGDSRERSREKARETLVVVGGFAFRAAGSGSGSQMGRSKDGKGGPETPMQLFERFLREGGLMSKVWRVREQAILTLVHIRRAHHLFPIRPYLSHLVDALEDTDGNVRECARTSVVELFTGPGVTDMARADLKKEMTKKGVRKTIVDGVLSKVLAAGGRSSTPASMSENGSENGDTAGGAPKEYVPPSIALLNRRPGPTLSQSSGMVSRTASHGNVREIPRPASRAAAMSPTGEGPSTPGGGADVKAVYIASSRDLENEFASMLRPFEGKETEHNWADREQAIQRVRGMLKGEVHERYTDVFLYGLKNGFMEASLKTLASLRTTVATNTCTFYSELSIALGTALDPFCDLLFTNLFRMASLTKKITAQISQATVTTVIQNVAPQPKLIIPLVWNTLQDKAIQTRLYAVSHVKTYLQVHGARTTHAIEATSTIDTLEKIVRKALGDANAGVRDNARQLFWIFQGFWPDRAAAILQALDSVSRKQLEKACPNPEALAVIVPGAASPPKAKKSSVAAAIAASRAKAKAIATAPPTLRHQATSTSHTIRATSPPTRRPASPSLSTSSSAGNRATSPVSRSSPPRSRIVSGGTLSRSTSSNTGLSTSARSPPRQRQSSSPPSPTSEQTFARRLSSPLTTLNAFPPNSNSTFRKAVETALPASPPGSVINFTSPTPRPQKVGQAAAVPVYRESLSIAGLHQLAGNDEESLLLATNIPVPEDSDSDMELDDSINLISFSTPYEVYPPKPRSNSQANSFSPGSTTTSKRPFSNALSTGTASPPAGVAAPLVEDAMRARAEQAESAAERLLELVEPEDDHTHPSPIPAALLLRNGEGQGGKPKPRVGGGSTVPTLPRTPVNNKRNTAIMQQAALFQDSPALNGKTTSLFALVDGRDSAGQWWAKRMAVLKIASPHEDVGTPDREQTLQPYIAALDQGSADVPVLKNLARLCTQNPVHEPLSPVSPAFSVPLTPSPLDGFARQLTPSRSDYWRQDKLFDRLFNALVKFLDRRTNAEELEYGLIVLWEMLENQAPLLEGREADIFSVLLQIRYCAQMNVMQATNLFRDTLTSRIEPVYGLTTLHAALRAFRYAPLPPEATTEIRDGTYAFGLIALGKFFLRLPAEVLEEELPRLRSTLNSALTESSRTSSLAVREAATAATIAAQMVLRDETHLFTLLDGLPDEKKNLLTYMFDKHGARGPARTAEASAMEKLEREMRRIDGRLSTPRRV
ncbi:clasp N terminal-domain-containing protein [Daedaleopsis nitida]|nr:clasp N terminal-domain-containing protein [Daedaleopsis nitida]